MHSKYMPLTRLTKSVFYVFIYLLFAGASISDALAAKRISYYSLVVSVKGTGGLVTSSPAGITNCSSTGGTCKAAYTSGTKVSLTATPTAGYIFSGWSGACSGTAGCTTTMTTARTITATFTATAPTTYQLSVTVNGAGGTVATTPAGISGCSSTGGTCKATYTSGANVLLTATPLSGYNFTGWGGACSGTGNCAVTITAVTNVTATFTNSQQSQSSIPGISTCAPGSGHDYQVGSASGQLGSLDQVPWESLAAGDTVRIFYNNGTPYRGHMLLAAKGTASAPVRICGVKGPNGERPIIDGQNAVARKGLSYTSASYGPNIQETRAVVMIDRLGTQGWTDYPSYIQIDGLEIRGATPSNSFTNSFGGVQNYVAFGACIWIDRGQNVTIADNIVHDCTNGIFARSTEDGDFARTKDIRVAGNSIYGNGVENDDHEHNTYIESIGVTYEFNHYGPLRTNALGAALKDRSVGTIVRFNKFDEGSRALDLVEAEDFPTTAMTYPAYRTTYVYGNEITKNGTTGSVIHYGGDHFGSAPGATWGEPIFRAGTLYFFNNTVHVTGTDGGMLFQLSTTKEVAEVWNNVFHFDTIQNGASVARLRMGWQDVNTQYWTPNGIIHLGRNWLTAGWVDSDEYHPLQGSVTGMSNQLTGSTAPINWTTFTPIGGSSIIDAGQANLAAVANYPVNYQLDPSFAPTARQIKGSAADLGAVEY